LAVLAKAPAAAGFSRQSDRALIAGVLFIITLITAIAGLLLYDPGFEGR
jgi:hypothetical protein